MVFIKITSIIQPHTLTVTLIDILFHQSELLYSLLPSVLKLWINLLIKIDS